MADRKERGGRTVCEWLGFFYERLEETFQNNIPFETVKELDFKFVLLFGIVLYSVYYGLFAFFMYSTYEGTINAKYISLESGDTCHTVPIVTTGSYMSDTSGYWVGDSQFVYSHAEFELVLTSFSIDSESQYKAMMNTFRDSFTFLSEKTERVGLIYSLLAWMSFVRYYSVDYPSLTTDFFTIGYGNLQYMQLTGTPAAVFNLRYTQFKLGSYRGVCDASNLAGNTPSDYQLSVIYSLPSYQASSLCIDALDPSTFDIYSSSNSQFNFALDTRSFSTAMAVNYGILDITELAPVADSFHNITVQGVKYLMGSYFDVRYASMDPIVCYRNTTPARHTLFQDSELCTIIKGTSTLGLPTFNHIGSSYNSSYPSYCGSSTDSGACDEFLLMSGLILFPPDVISTSGAMDITLMKQQMIRLIEMLDNGPYINYEQFNKAAYNATFITTASGFTGFEPQYATPEFFNESFAFCRANFSDPKSDTCTLMVFYQKDYSNNYVSDYHFRLTNGSKSSSITVTDSCWDHMIDNPPVSLIESYYECHPTVIDTLQNSQGIAAGNIDSAMMIIIPILFAPFVYFLLYSKSREPENEDFLRQHKEELNDLLMNLLLRTMKAEKLAMEAEEAGGEGEGEGGGEHTPSGATTGGYTYIPSDSAGPAAVVSSGNEHSKRRLSGGVEMMQAVIRGITNNGLIMTFGRELYHYSKVKQRDDDIESQSESCCFNSAINRTNDTLMDRAIECQEMSSKTRWQKSKSTTSINGPEGSPKKKRGGRDPNQRMNSQLSASSDMITL